jgi:uncharacterized protein YecT (DUF1311 family)
LPDEATLKQRYAAVDKKLNENYKKLIAEAEKEDKETVAELKRSQHEWLWRCVFYLCNRFPRFLHS